MFAQRTAWNLEENNIAAAVNDLKATATDILDLTESNPTACHFSYPRDEILKSFCNKENLLYEPKAQGSLKAREAVCDYYAQKQITVKSENVFLTASTSEAYALLFRLLADPGDRILFPLPSYPLFQFLCDINDVELVYYSLKYDGLWRIAPRTYAEQAAVDKIKAFTIVNPNNPTGSLLRQEELQVINRFCEAQGLAIISDEVFSDFLHAGSPPHVSLASNNEVLSFTLGGLSKTLALPQMKLSWIILSGPEHLVRQARSRLEVIADMYLSVNTPVQNALPDLLSLRESIQAEICQRLRMNYDYLKGVLAGNTDRMVLNAEGGWYAVLKFPGLKHEEQLVLDLIQHDHVLVHPGYFYDFEDDGYVVLSLIVDNDVFKQGFQKLCHRMRHA